MADKIRGLTVDITANAQTSKKVWTLAASRQRKHEAN